MIFLFKLKRYIQIHLFSDKHQNVKGDFYNIYTYDEIDFDAKIKTFIIGIIQVLTKHRIEDYDYMMLSHFFSNINNFNEFNGILGLNKMIVIYRDPRDVFATLINRDSSWSGVSEKNSIEENIENFKIYYKHNNISNLNDLSKDILIVKFERLIHNYEIERGRIFKFLNILSGFSDSVFSPNDSIKNIGIYKNIEPVYKELFDYLIREYPEHCEK